MSLLCLPLMATVLELDLIIETPFSACFGHSVYVWISCLEHFEHLVVVGNCRDAEWYEVELVSEI
jgi:hypothetical protein